MTTPRITQRLMVENSLSSLRTGMGRLARTQEQLSSGRTLNRPSDSPGSTHTAMRMREQLAANEQAVRNAEDGAGWLQRTDSTLSSMLDQVRRARDLTVQGANTGASSPQAREAIAAELTQVRESLLAQANTQHLGRPLFGGTTAGAAAYAADGRYLGDAGVVSRSVSDQQQVTVNTTGPEAFGDGPDSIFAVLDQTIAHLRGDGSQVGGDLTRIDAAMTRMQHAQASAGARQNRVEAALTDVSAATLDLRAMLSQVENVDMAKAITDLQMQEVAYQAALGATARVLQPSLMDFLR